MKKNRTTKEYSNPLAKGTRLPLYLLGAITAVALLISIPAFLVSGASEDLFVEDPTESNTWEEVTSDRLLENDLLYSSTITNGSLLEVDLTAPEICNSEILSLTVNAYAYSSSPQEQLILSVNHNLFPDAEEPSHNKDNYSLHTLYLPTTPNGSPWTCEELDDLAIRISSVQDEGADPELPTEWRVSSAWVSVEYARTDPEVNQRSYRWQYDTLEVDEAIPADTPLRQVSIGQQLALRVQLDNTSPVSTGEEFYPLQYSENQQAVACKDVTKWVDLDATSPITYTNVSVEMIEIASTDASDSCSGGDCEMFVSSRWGAQGASTVLLKNSNSELGYTLDTTNAKAGAAYCLRVAPQLSGSYYSYPEISFAKKKPIQTLKPLRATKTPEIKANKIDYTASESPNFELEYFDLTDITDPYTLGVVEEGRIFEQEEFKIEANLYDPFGRLSQAIPQISFLPDGHMYVELNPQNDFKPGVYSLQVSVSEIDYADFIVEQDFTWGVLAINTNKPTYSPGEVANIAMTVLDDNGSTVCDATVSLTISSPSGIKSNFSTAKGTVSDSDDCAPNNVTYIPDYSSVFKGTGEEGTYGMTITATTANGTRSLTDRFYVDADDAFKIEREGPVRIYPKSPYTMGMKFTPTADYKGAVTEVVPTRFAISGKGFSTAISGDNKAITWNVNWKAGQTYNLQYTFDAPDVSPEFFLAGPIQIGDFREARQWQIASDDISNLTTTACDFEDLPDATCQTAIVADGGSSYAFGKGKHIDAALATLGSVGSVTSATLYYDSWGSLTGTWGVYLKDSRDGTTICSIDPAPEDGSETRNSISCNSVTPAQLAAGVWLQVNNDDSKGSEDINLDYVYLNVDYTPAASTIDISGSCKAYNQSTNCADSESVRVAVNGSLQAETGSTSGGSWSITGVTEPTAGNIVTVYVETVADALEAVAVTEWGSGNITNMQLFEEHLTIGSNQNTTLTSAELGDWDYSASGNNEDIFFDVDGSNNLTVDSTSQSSQEELYIYTGNTYTPEATINTHDLEIDGTLTGGSSAIKVAGSWDNNSVFTAGTSTVTFNATTGTETIDSTGASISLFNTLNLGETSGTATWNLSTSLDVDGVMTIDWGTLGMNGSNNINLSNNLVINANGNYTSGTGNFTFDGSGTSTWNNAATLDDLGTVVIDGTTKTVNLSSSASATKLSIGADDIFGLASSGYTLTLTGNGSGASRPFLVNAGGTFNEGTSSTIKFTSNSALDLQNETYDNLEISPGSGGGPNITLATGAAQTINANTLTIGDGTNAVNAVANTNNPTINATRVIINTNGTYTEGSATTTISGSGTTTSRPLYINGGTFTSGSGTVKFTGTAASDIQNATYNNLELSPSGAGGPLFNLMAGTIATANMTVGDGTNAVTVNADTNDPTLNTSGTFTILANGIFTASASGSFTVGTAWTNAGTFNHSSGTVVMNDTVGSNSINSTGATIATFSGLTLGSGSGTATWTLGSALDVDGVMLVDWGTLDMNGANAVDLGGDLTINANGNYTSSTGTLTFNGTGTNTLTNAATLDNLGAVVVNGTAKTINLGSSTTITSLNIGGDDVLGLSSSGYTMTVTGSGTAGSRPFIVTAGGTLNEGTNSTFAYTGTTATDIEAETYYNLNLIPSGGAGPMYTLGTAAAQTIGAYNLTIGDGTNNSTITGATNNPTLNISNNLGFAATATNTLTTGTGIWTVSGNADFTGGTVTATIGNTIKMGGTAKTITPNAQTIQNFEVTGGSISNVGALDINGTFTTSGTGGYTHTSGTNINIAGNFTLGNGTTFTNPGSCDPAPCDGTLTLDGDLDYADNTSPLQDIGDVVIGLSPDTTILTTDFAANTLTITSADFMYTCEYDLDIGNGGLQISGTLDTSASGGGSCTGNEADETYINTANDFNLLSGSTFVQDQSTIEFDDNSGTDTLITDGAFSLYNVILNGSAMVLQIQDPLDIDNDLTITAGTLDTVSGENNAINVGGSWDKNGGTFTPNNSVITFDSADTGEIIESGGSSFYDIVFNNAGGGWTIQTDNLTTSNDFTITDTAASGFTANTVTVEVQGAYSIADAETSNTTWTSSTLYLNSASAYLVGSKTQNAEVYSTLQLGANTDIDIWNSSASTYTVDVTASLYSQDHTNVNGDLYIWGDYHAKTAEYWSYATDFDGTDLTGVERQVDVLIDPASKVTVDSGDTHASIGGSANRTTVNRQGASNGYEISVLSGGTINYQYTDFDFLDGALGLDIQASSTVTSLDYTDFDNLVGTAGSADAFITVASTVIGSGTKTITGAAFNNTGTGAEFNVNRTGADDTGYWDFDTTTGTFDSEANDGDDGVNEADPGMLRWDDSTLNVAPDDPTSLVQKKTDDTVIVTADWTDETSVKFTAQATDTDNPDTLYLCIEADELGTAFSDTEDSCGSGVAYSGSAVEVIHTLSGLVDGGEYHWQGRIKDSASTYSGWVSYDVNTEAQIDFGIDTTDPTVDAVYDGDSAGVDLDWNTGSLTVLEANWEGTDNESGIKEYEYAIGTTSGGTEILTWTSAGVSTSFNETIVTAGHLHTGQMYYASVRATNNAEAVGSVLTSDGLQVLPTFSFGVDSSSINFLNLNPGTSWTDTQTTTTTTSTNAYGGYVITLLNSQNLTNTIAPSNTIGNYSGTNGAPTVWSGLGFGYSTNDSNLSGGAGNRFTNGGPKYAGYSFTGSGVPVADHTAVVTGQTGAVSAEQFIITYKVQVDASQIAGPYTTNIVYIATPTF